MKGSKFIHCILVVALCFGQVVANAHVIAHIGANNVQTNHLSVHTHSHAHSQDHHSKSLSIKKASSDDAKDANSDCAIYHAYAGSAAITPAVCSAVAIGQRRTLAISYHHSNIYTGSAATQPIRGPPALS